MPVLDIFSKRQKRSRGEVPDVYQYDVLPQSFRVQVVHIWQDVFGTVRRNDFHSESVKTYGFIASALCREYGLFELPHNSYPDNRFEELTNFVLQEKDVERVIDAIDLSFRIAWVRDSSRDHSTRRNRDAIKELNQRFKEHGIGFQFIDGKVIRVDAEYVHSEVVKPALKLLHGRRYAGAQEDFSLSAHQHYRKGEDEGSSQ